MDNKRSVEIATQDAIKSILKWTNKNAELAHQVATDLASLDWQQVILTLHQEEINSRMRVMEDFLEWKEKGGGFCDDCTESDYEGGYHRGPMYIRVYAWPHSVSPYSYLTVDYASARHYCWKCFCKMQYDAETRLTNEQYRKNPKDFFIWTKRMDRCNKCERMFPKQSGYQIKENDSVNLYCLHCIEQSIVLQFTVCKICDKKTLNHNGDYCYNCYSVISPFTVQVSSHLARARAANTPATLTVKQWIETVTYFNKKCAYCLSRPFQVLEHFLPINLGGGTTANNCVPACQNCNSRKSGTHPDKLVNTFPHGTIEGIKRYLEGKGHESNIFDQTLSGRELVLIKKEQP